MTAASSAESIELVVEPTSSVARRVIAAGPPTEGGGDKVEVELEFRTKAKRPSAVDGSSATSE